MPDQSSLDALLGREQPYATFHDAEITRITVDYSAKRFVAEMGLCVGDPDATGENSRERHGRGELIIEGLVLWSLEPPHDIAVAEAGPLWLTADGTLAEAPTELGKVLAQKLTPGQVGWFMFFNNLNAFA